MTKTIDIDKVLLNCEVKLKNEKQFNVVIETLERIGMVNKDKKTLYQSCHILHKKNKYYIVHFKEMFKLDGKYCDMNYKDLAIRNLIASLLEKWGLIEIINKSDDMPIANHKSIYIISHEDKKNWTLSPKYKFLCYR